MSNKVKKVLGNKIVLTSPAKETKTNGMIMVPTISTNVGVIKFIGEDLKERAERDGLGVGQKVIYGSQFETLQIENQDSFVMELSNIIAVLE